MSAPSPACPGHEKARPSTGTISAGYLILNAINGALKCHAGAHLWKITVGGSRVWMRLPSHGTSRSSQLLLFSACAILLTVKASQAAVFPDSGLAPLGVTPMSGAHESVETNRRPASPPDIGRQFGSTSCAPPSLSAAVAHPWRPRHRMEPTVSLQKAVCLTALAAAVLTITAGCEGRNAGGPGDVSSGIVIEPSGLISLQDLTAKTVASAPPRITKGGGLVGVLGGARVKLLKAGTHEVLLPMPQLTESQTPVCYGISTTPREAAKEYRLHLREESNAVVSVRLQGRQDQEVQIDWSSIILVADRHLSPDRSPPAIYLQPTACVQSGAKSVRISHGSV